MNWEILEYLASGTFGSIYKVRNRKTNQFAAYKKIHQNFNNEKDRQRIKRSFFASSKLKQINCIKMLEWIENPNEFGFVMEFIEGKTISTLKNNSDSFSLPNIIDVLIQVCNGLDALHGNNLIHRDLKPENILVNEKGIAKITDFDLAKIGNSVSVSNSGRFLGSVKYSSPEQCRNSSKIDHRSDLYSLGVIFYELVTGKVPFEGENFAQVGIAHLKSPIISPRKIIPELPIQIENVIKKLLEKNPQNRFQSAREVSRVLSNFLNEKSKGKLKTNKNLGEYLLPPTFTGRNYELQKLESTFTEITNDNFKSIFISGEIGIGKTKLWEEFQLGLTMRDVLVLSTKFTKDSDSYDALKEIIFQGIDSLSYKSAEEQIEFLGKFGWDLEEIAPEISKLSFMHKIKKEQQLGGTAKNFRLFEVLTNFLKKLSKEFKGLILFLDDLHFCSDLVSDWLNFSLQNLRGFPILLIYSADKNSISENSTLQKRFSYLVKDENTEILELKSINLKSVSVMLTSILGKSDSVNSNFAKMIQQKTGGNPFFIQEVLRHLFETGSLQKENGEWNLDLEKIADSEMPKTISDLFTKKIRKLESSLRKSLQACSILGYKFDLENALKVSKSDEESLLKKLNIAEDLNLIIITKNGEFSFTHEIIRETLKSSLKKSKRKKLHKLIGERLETKFSSQKEKVIEELAYHFFEAEIFDKAKIYCGEAAEYFEKRNLILKAIRSLEQKTSLLDKTKEIPEIINTLVAKKNLLARIGKFDEATKVILKAQELAEKTNDNQLLGKVYLNYSAIPSALGDYKNALTLSEKAFKHFEKINNVIGMASAINTQGNSLSKLGKFENALEYYQKAIELNHKERPQDVPYILNNIGTIYFDLGNYGESLKYQKSCLEPLRKNDDKSGTAVVLVNIGMIYSLQNELGKAQKTIEESIALAEEVLNFLILPVALVSLASIYLDKGNLEEFWTLSQRALKHARNINDNHTEVQIKNKTALFYLKTKNYSKAEETLIQNLSYFERIESQNDIAYTLGVLGEVLQEQGKNQLALENFEKAIELSEKFELQDPLSFQFLGIAKVYFNLLNFSQSEIFCKKALEIASKISKFKEVFNSKVLLAKLEANKGNKQEAENILLSLLNLTKEEIHFSILYETLWETSKKLDYLEKAIQFYTKIFAKFPAKVYESKLKELKEQKSFTKFSELNNFDFQVLQKLIGTLSPESAFVQLLDHLVEVCDSDGSQIILQNKVSQELEICAVSPNLQKEEAEFSYGVLENVIKNEQVLCLENAIKSPELRGNQSIVGKVFLSIIAVPLKIQNKVCGAIYLDRKDLEKGSFKIEDLKKVQQIADLLTPLIVRYDELRKFRAESQIKELGIFVGNSNQMQRLYQEIEKASKFDSTVYIYGETGTGKELVAKSLHKLSRRKNKPFIPINCAAIPDNLAESELFGFVKGSFSGAERTKLGKFELANGGVIFLDEISELPLNLQAKLLRVLQEKEVWKVGAESPVKIDVRVIVATNKNLTKEVEKGNFREDLFYRLNVLKINLPPLRERVEDIAPLAFYFLEKFAPKIKGFEKEAIIFLQTLELKGNVRELENLIEKIVVNHTSNSPIKRAEFANFHPKRNQQSSLLTKEVKSKLNLVDEIFTNSNLNSQIEKLEKFSLTQTLQTNKGHLSNSCKDLGIDFKRMQRLLEKHKINPKKFL
ncbi:MAG: tetratricopeptide repeat protein [Calditrichaeota bacterium]|nr:MAG: tetratricopeptide repeat protein [Calditrichota bacterium]